MRGKDEQQQALFSYGSMEERVPADHPLRTIRAGVDHILGKLSPKFDELYDADGRPSIAPERLLRALLLQVLYSVWSERMLMEQLQYNLRFRGFVGLSMDEPVWRPTVFGKNRDRLLSNEHFTVDGTLIEAWAGQKSFSRSAPTTAPIRPASRRRAAIRPWIIAARSAATRRANRRPIPNRGSTARATTWKRSCATWGMW